jgi:hypothetical protein
VILAVRRCLVPRTRVKQIFSPPQRLAGRAGALRIKHRKGIFLLVVMYMPSAHSVAANEIACQLWSWLHSLLDSLPRRSMPSVLTDANARLGSIQLRTPEGQLQIGSYGHLLDNSPGRRMRNFLETSNLVAVNTLFEAGSGCTWFITRGHEARIDYVLTSAAAADVTVSVEVQR